MAKFKAIRANQISLESIEGDFTDNTATNGSGGAIYINKNDYAAANIEKIEGDFIGNTSGERGGAIWSSVGIDLLKGDFRNNTSRYSGSAVYLDSTTNGSIIANFINNTSTSGDAALDLKNSSANLIQGNFTNNKSASNGGALTLYNDNNSVSRYVNQILGDFTGNVANSQGGALNSNIQVGQITGDFKNNIAYKEGGAMYFSVGNEKTILATENNPIEISGNISGTGGNGRYGGAIYNTGGTLNIVAQGADIRFFNNKSNVTLTQDANGFYTVVDSATGRYSDIQNENNGIINLNAATGKTISFGGMVNYNNWNVNKGVNNIGGNYVFNNIVGGDAANGNGTFNLYNNPNITLGSYLQADGTTSYGKFNLSTLTQDANGSVVNAINNHVDKNFFNYFNIASDMHFSIDYDMDTDTSDSFQINNRQNTGRIILDKISVMNEHDTGYKNTRSRVSANNVMNSYIVVGDNYQIVDENGTVLSDYKAVTKNDGYLYLKNMNSQTLVGAVRDGDATVDSVTNTPTYTLRSDEDIEYDLAHYSNYDTTTLTNIGTTVGNLVVDGGASTKYGINGSTIIEGEEVRYGGIQMMADSELTLKNLGSYTPVYESGTTNIIDVQIDSSVNGFSNTNGVVYVNGGTLKIENSVFSDNIGSGNYANAAVIYTAINKTSNIEIKNSVFKDNVSNRWGGVLLSHDNSNTTTIKDSIFIHNTTNSNTSGNIEIHGTGLIENSVFIDNVGQTSNAAPSVLWVVGGTTDIKGSRFINNSGNTTIRGTSNGRIGTIIDSYFEANGNEEFALREVGTIDKIQNTTFTGYSGGDSGGAAFWGTNIVDFIDSTVSNMKSGFYNGSVDNVSGSTFDLTGGGTAFSVNKSITDTSVNNGLVYLNSGNSVTINDLTLFDASLNVKDNVKALISGLTTDGSASNQSYQIQLEANNRNYFAQIEDSTLENAISGGHGRNIRNNGGYVVIKNSTFTNNNNPTISTSNTSAINSWNGATTVIIDSTFTDMAESTSGSIFWNEGSASTAYLIADSSNIEFSGNVTEGRTNVNSMFNDGTMYLNAATGRSIIADEQVRGNGTLNINYTANDLLYKTLVWNTETEAYDTQDNLIDQIGGTYQFNSLVNGNVNLYNNAKVVLGEAVQYNNNDNVTYGNLNLSSLTNDTTGGSISSINGHADINNFGTLTLNSNITLGIDVDLGDNVALNSTADQWNANTITANDYHLDIKNINVIQDSGYRHARAKITDKAGMYPVITLNNNYSIEGTVNNYVVTNGEDGYLYFNNENAISLVSAVRDGDAPVDPVTNKRTYTFHDDESVAYDIAHYSNYLTTDTDKIGRLSSTLVVDGNGYSLNGDNKAGIYLNTGADLLLKNINDYTIEKNADGSYKFDANGNVTGIDVTTSVTGFNGSILYATNNINNVTLGVDNVLFYNNNVGNNSLMVIYGSNTNTLSSLNADFIGNTGNYIADISTDTNVPQNITTNFINNTARNCAPLWLYYVRGTVDTLSGDFISNTNLSTGSSGGAISLLGRSNDNRLNINKITGNFINNYSAFEGGAIFRNDNAYINSIVDTNFTHNMASSYGGAIVGYLNTSFTDVNFTNNIAGGGGGALHIWGQSNIKAVDGDIIFTGNRAAGRGGALSSHGNDRLSAISGNITFYDNKENVTLIRDANNNNRITGVDETTGNYSDIYRNDNLYLNAAKGQYISLSSTIGNRGSGATQFSEGGGVTGGDYIINNTMSSDIWWLYNDANIKFRSIEQPGGNTTYGSLDGTVDISTRNGSSAVIDTINGRLDTGANENLFKNLELYSNLNLAIDVDLENTQADTWSYTGTISGGGKIVINAINLLTSSDEERVDITLTEDEELKNRYIVSGLILNHITGATNNYDNIELSNGILSFYMDEVGLGGTLDIIRDASMTYIDSEPDVIELTDTTAGEGKIAVKIGNTTYYFTPDEADRLTLTNLVNTGHYALTTTDSASDAIFKVGNDYYKYDKTKLSRSIWTALDGVAPTYDNEGAMTDPGKYSYKVYNVGANNTLTPTYYTIKLMTSRLRTENIGFVKDNTRTSRSDFTYSVAGGVGTGTFEVKLPYNGNASSSGSAQKLYYTYTYQNLYADKAAHAVIDNLSEDINGEYFTNIPQDGTAIINTSDAGYNITADFIANYINRSQNGGGIRNEGILGDINGSFIGNSSAKNGGAIYNAENASINSITGTFIANSASWGTGGGAIYNAGEIGSINGNFIDNWSDVCSGAGIYNAATGSIGDITSNFVANRNNFGVYNLGNISSITGDFMSNYNGLYNGGAGHIGTVTGDFIANNSEIAVDTRGTSTIDSIYGDFIGNSLSAAIYMRDTSHIGTITGDFIDNTGNAGSAIRLDNSASITSIEGDFRNNTSNSSGGAIDINNTGSNIGSITGDFIGNSAGGYGGGAIYAGGSIDSIDGSFIGNTTINQGGAIKLSGNGAITRTINGEFINNTARSDGGAIRVDNSASLGTINGNFTGNKSGGHGGAIYHGGGQTGTVNGNFENNTAGGSGGAIYNVGNSNTDLTLGTTSIINNYAGGSGGAIYNSFNAKLNITAIADDINISGNRAATNGGAIYNESGSIYLTADGADITFSNNKAGVTFTTDSDGFITGKDETSAFAEDIYNKSYLYLSAKAGKAITINGGINYSGNGITYVGGTYEDGGETQQYTGDVVVNNGLRQYQLHVLDGATLKLNGDLYLSGTSTTYGTIIFGGGNVDGNIGEYSKQSAVFEILGDTRFNTGNVYNQNLYMHDHEISLGTGFNRFSLYSLHADEGAVLNLQNEKASDISFNDLALTGDISTKLDINLVNSAADKFVMYTNNLTGDGTINISDVNLLGTYDRRYGRYQIANTSALANIIDTNITTLVDESGTEYAVRYGVDGDNGYIYLTNSALRNLISAVRDGDADINPETNIRTYTLTGDTSVNNELAHYSNYNAGSEIGTMFANSKLVIDGGENHYSLIGMLLIAL